MVANERVDAEVAGSLLAYLRKELANATLSYADAPVRLPGGNETFIYAFRLLGASAQLSGPLILRAYRAGYARPDQARFESAVQNALAGLGYPAARVFVTAPEPDVLGTPFIIMERLPGTLLLEGIGKLDDSGKMRFEQSRSFLRGIGLVREIPRICAEAQARLRALDPQPLLDALQREGLPLSTLTFDGRLQALRSSIEADQMDGLREAFSWLIDHQPPVEQLAVCHGDTQPNNILMTGKTITGVVDWSQAIVADAAFDVGFTKMAFETVPLQLPTFLQWAARPMTRLLVRQYMNAYRRRLIVNPEAVRYYGAFRCVFALALISDRRLAGHAEPDVWDNPAGIRNLVSFVRSATGIAVRLPADGRIAGS